MAHTLRLAVVAVVLMLAMPSEGSRLNNTVTDWGDAILNQTRSLNISHQITARLLALTHLAQYKALAANDDLQLANDEAVAGKDSAGMTPTIESDGTRMRTLSSLGCVRVWVVCRQDRLLCYILSGEPIPVYHAPTKFLFLFCSFRRAPCPIYLLPQRPVRCIRQPHSEADCRLVSRSADCCTESGSAHCLCSSEEQVCSVTIFAPAFAAFLLLTLLCTSREIAANQN